MQLRVLTHNETELEFEVLGENETLLNPVKSALLDHDGVDLAEYVIPHPQLSVPRIYLRVKEGNDPKAILLQAMERVQKEIETFQVTLNKMA